MTLCRGTELPILPLLQRRRFCAKIKRTSTACSCQKSLLGQDYSSYALHPKTSLVSFALPLLSTHHRMNPPKGDREKKGPLLFPEAHAMAVPCSALLCQGVWVPGTTKLPCAPTDTQQPPKRKREGLCGPLLLLLLVQLTSIAL